MSNYGATGAGDTSRVGQLRGQVDEVKGLMVENIDRVQQRGENLYNLDERTKILEQDAKQFNQLGGDLKKKMWWKNVKLWIILIIIVIVILIAIIIAIVLATK
ncbi:vesicle-associated membrane protein 8-like [Dysidea avara]|uniref:vesicle-associated membrane protein 8-like n=1 Tax=Dysidea avara TaxID=196820 RepID=UPI00332C0385